tara:strand:+ start:1602 stop:10832 length:9231 start_codon:yes stop_codon:yes gene_type:complete
MSNQQPVFLDFLYKQLLSLMARSTYRFHVSNKNCFESIINEPNNSLIIQAQHIQKSATLPLPILSSLQVIPNKQSKVNSFNVLSKQMTTLLTHRNKKNHLFEEFYFSSSFIRSLTKNTFNSYKKLPKTQLPEDINGFFITISSSLSIIINQYDSSLFWAYSDHLRFLKRMLAKSSSLQKNITLDRAEGFFSLLPTMLLHLKESGKAVYTVQSTEPESFNSDFKIWNQHLGLMLSLIRATIQAYLVMCFYKLHYLTILISLSNQQPNDDYDDSFQLLIRDLQTKLVYNLFFQQGLLHDISTHFQDIFNWKSSFYQDIQSCDHETKESFFELKNQSLTYIQSIKDLTIRSWVDYFNRCFSTNLDLLATSIITYYHDVFPVNDFSEIIAEYLCSYETSLEKYVSKLPKSIQNVSNPSIKIEENLSHSIGQLSQKIYHLLVWSTILSFYVSLLGRYSLISDKVVLIYRNHSKSKLSPHLLSFMPILFSTHTFNQCMDYLSQLYPDSLLSLIDSTIMLYPAMDVPSLENDETFLTWYNSIHFLNRCTAIFRSYVFKCSSTIWKSLYSQMSYKFLTKSNLFNTWIEFAPTHTLEFECLMKLTHFISSQPSHETMLFFILIRTQHINLNLNELDNVKLTYNLTQSTLADYFKNINYLYEITHEESLYAIDLLALRLLNYCNALHSYYSSDVVIAIIKPHLDSFVFLLGISLQHQLSSFRPLILFLGLFYYLNPSIKHDITKLVPTYFSLKNNQKENYHFIQKNQHDIPSLPLQLLTDLATYFSTPPLHPKSKSSFEDNSTVPQTYLSSNDHIKKDSTSPNILNEISSDPLIEDPYFLIASMTPLIRAYYSAKASPDSQNFEYVDIQKTILAWLSQNMPLLTYYLSGSLCKSLTQLLNYSKDNKMDEFLNHRNHLISLLFSLKSISLLQQILIAHLINIISCLVDVDNDSLILLTPSLYVFEFDITHDKHFLQECLRSFSFQIQQLETFTLSDYDILALQKIFISFKECIDTLNKEDCDILELILSVLTAGLDQLSKYDHHKFEAIFSLLNQFYDFIEIIPPSTSLFKHLIYKLLPYINYLCENGFINHYHPMFSIITTLHDEHPHPSDTLIECHNLVSDYKIFLTCISLSSPLNVNLFEAIIQKPYIQHSLTYLFLATPGMLLSFSLFLLTYLKKLSKEDEDHGICFFLNTLFNQDLDLFKWQEANFFFYLLKSFYDYNDQPEKIDHTMGLSLQDPDTLIISSLILECPQQAKQLILRLHDLSHSSQPLLKNIILSLIENSLKYQLSDPLVSLKAISNNSLKETVIMKNIITQNANQIFQQLSQLIASFSKKDIRSDTLEAFILKANTYLKTFSVTSSFLAEDDHSSNYADQLFKIMRTIDLLSNSLDTLAPDVIQQLYRNICNILSRYILDLFLIKNFESASIDYFFSTHQTLLLDELKTIIMDNNFISFHQTLTLLQLLQHSPEQLSYSRFSYWFSYLDILSFSSEDDLKLVIFECALIDGSMALDIIKSQDDPFYYLNLLHENHSSLVFYLLRFLQQSPIESDQKLFLTAQQSFKNHSFLSYFNATKKSTHPIDSYVSHIYNSDKININVIVNLLYNLLPHHTDQFIFCLELLYLNKPASFWVLCKNNQFEICLSILELIIQNNTDNSLTFSPNILNQWLMHPTFLNYFPHYLEPSTNSHHHPLLIHSNIECEPSSLEFFNDYDIVNWIDYCFQFNKLSSCFKYLESRDYASADCFYIMFFTANSNPSFNSGILLNYLDYLDDITLASFINHLDEIFHVTHKDFTIFILKSISSLSNFNAYHELLIRCAPYLNLLQDPLILPSLSSSANHIIGYASLCYMGDLSLADICKFLKQCNFVPSIILAKHIVSLSDAIFDESKHHFLTDLSLHYPEIFSQLFLHETFATTIQQALYYKELTEDSLLFNHITKAIDSFNYVYSLQFLAHYAKKHLTVQKQTTCYELLDSFLPFSSDNVRTNFDDLALLYKETINTPIPRIAVTDQIINLLFKKLPTLRQNLHITEQLYCFLSSNSKALIQHGIDPIHVKKQLEICCTELPSRKLLLKSLRHPSHDKALNLFCSFINGWEEKNSLFDTFNLYLNDNHEYHLMYDYLLFMTRLITRFSFKNFKLSLFKKLCFAIHFLLTHSPDKPYLNQWFINSLTPNMKGTYFTYLEPVFSSNFLDKKTLIFLTKSFINHQKTACYSPLFKACFLNPAFIDIWDYFISHSKKHIILSDLLVESSSLHTNVELFLRNFIDYQPASLFSFCETHYQHAIFIDIFFNKLYDHYFSDLSIEETVKSLPASNAFIKVTEEAFQKQATGFIFFLARCIEHYLVPNKKNISWVIHLLTNRYRVSFSSFATDIDSSKKNTIIKQFMNAGIILDSGEFLVDLPAISLDQFVALNTNQPLTAEAEFAFINLQQTSIAYYQQRNHILDIFIQESPSFFIKKTSMLPFINQELGISFFKEGPSYIDYLFNVLNNSESMPLAMLELFALINKNNSLKSYFYYYIKQLPTDYLIKITTLTTLSCDQRHFILHGLLYDEKGNCTFDNNNDWENKAVDSLLSSLTERWVDVIHYENSKPYLEIIIFFFCYCPSSIETVLGHHYSLIYNHTGICLPKLFACKEHLENFLADSTETSFSFETFRDSVNNLLDLGFSLFEILVGYRASHVFNINLEKEWISLLLAKETVYSISTTPSWLINIFDLLCIKQKTYFIPNSFFETSVHHQAFKRWLFNHGYLSHHNLLSLTSLHDFNKLYDPNDVYEQMMIDISTMISQRSISKTSINLLAEPFFELFFQELSYYFNKPTIHVMECSILLDMIDTPASFYEQSFLIKQLNYFQDALYKNNLALLLNVYFIPFVLCLLKTPDNTISIEKTHNLIESIPLTLDLNHAIFNSLTEKEKSLFKLFLVKHNLLQHNVIHTNSLLMFKKQPSLSNDHFEAFSLIDKYIITQKSLLESALTTISQLGFILFYPEAVANSHFLNQFSSILDHEWVYLSHFLNQSIENNTIESYLQNFINNSATLSKDLLKKHAASLKNSDDTHELSVLFLDFQKHSQNVINTSHTPSIQFLLEELMVSIDKNSHFS